MKTTVWTLPLLVALAACSKSPANNVAAGNNVAAPANETAPAPPANTTAATDPSGLPAGLDCIKNALSPEERRAVADAAAEQASRDDPRAQPLVRAVDTCAAQYSWSPAKRRLAGTFTLSNAGLSALQEELTGQGLDLAELNQAIESDQELMTAANTDQMGTAGQAFAQRHAALLERLLEGRDAQVGTRIGNYIAFRAGAIALAGRFAQEP
jgi:hypothetical protein